MFDMSYFGKFYLVGADASKAADWLFSADVSRPPGTKPGGHAPSCSAPGRAPWARLEALGQGAADPVASGPSSTRPCPSAWPWALHDLNDVLQFWGARSESRVSPGPPCL